MSTTKTQHATEHLNKDIRYLLTTLILTIGIGLLLAVAEAKTGLLESVTNSWLPDSQPVTHEVVAP